MSSFKVKYHGKLSKSKNYVAREMMAHALLLKYFGDGWDVMRVGKGVEVLGVIPDLDNVPRYDFVLKNKHSKDFLYVEVTGDEMDDPFAYFLTEKIMKAIRHDVCRKLVIMYNKGRKRSFRAFTCSRIVKAWKTGEAKLVNFAAGEKPYIRMYYKQGKTLRQFRASIGSIQHLAQFPTFLGNCQHLVLKSNGLYQDPTPFCRLHNKAIEHDWECVFCKQYKPRGKW